MGWKSTKTLSREHAIKLIIDRALIASDRDLGDILEQLGFGDNKDLPYFGYNFLIGEEEEGN